MQTFSVLYKRKDAPPDAPWIENEILIHTREQFKSFLRGKYRPGRPATRSEAERLVKRANNIFKAARHKLVINSKRSKIERTLENNEDV